MDATAKSPQVLFAAHGNLQKMQFSVVALQAAALKLFFASFSRIHQKIFMRTFVSRVVFFLCTFTSEAISKVLKNREEKGSVLKDESGSLSVAACKATAENAPVQISNGTFPALFRLLKLAQVGKINFSLLEKKDLRAIFNKMDFCFFYLSGSKRNVCYGKHKGSCFWEVLTYEVDHTDSLL